MPIKVPPRSQVADKPAELRVSPEGLTAPLARGQQAIRSGQAAVAGAAVDVTQKAIQGLDRLALKRSLNDGRKRADEFMSELTNLVAAERTKEGSDAGGAVERVESFIKEKTPELFEGIDDRVREQLQSRVQSSVRSSINALTLHEAKQIRAADDTSQALAQQQARQEIANNPADLPNAVKRRLDDIQLSRDAGFISEEEARVQKIQAMDDLARFNITNIAINEPEKAIELIDSGDLDALMTPKTQQEMEKLRGKLTKEVKRREKTAADDAKKAAKKLSDAKEQQFFLQADQGELTYGMITQAVADGEIDAATGKKWEGWIEGFAKNRDKYQKTNSAVLADLVTRMELDPDSVSQNEISQRIGKDISLSDGRKLFDDLEKAKKKESRFNHIQGAKEALKILDLSLKNGVFGDKDSIEAQQEWARQVELLKAGVTDGAIADPIGFVGNILSPQQKPLVKRVIDGVTRAFGGGAADDLTVVTEPERRREAIKVLQDNGKIVNETTIAQADAIIRGEETPETEAEF
jgi:hypothetical protein